MLRKSQSRSPLLYRLLATLLGLLTIAPALAEVRLPSMISDHMVVQRDIAFHVWGWADPGEALTVTFADHVEQTVADDQGRWRVSMPALEASAQPRTLTVAGQNTIEITDVLVGEVWLASGQSNMAWTVARSDNAEQEIAISANDQIRMWTAQRTVATEAQTDVPGNWQVAGPQTTGGFSAVAYFFARDLQAKLGVPVGILHSSWGGTPVEAWTSRPKLESIDVASPILGRFADALENYDQRKAEYQQQQRRFRETRLGPANTGYDAGFAQPDFDDNQWDPFPVPARWEDKEMHVDGVVWFRTTVTIPEPWAGQALTLDLGPIDDGDTTYFNNQQIGHTRPDTNQAWRQPRSYRVPAEQVKQGVATIAVRIIDTAGYGGIFGDPAGIRIYPTEAGPDNAINLAGDWKHHIAHQIDPRNAVTSAPRLPYGPEHQHSPAGLYNGMIAPIVPYTLRGAIWYQGESNASRAEQYETLFPAMIADWRERWGQGEFPFLFVQLANYRAPADGPTDTDWAHLRDAQLKTLREVPNTGMATIIDIGAANDIHPRNKQDVGSRLARWALHRTYELENVVPTGPIYRLDTALVMDVEGEKRFMMMFHVPGSELSVKDDAALSGFTIAGEDGKFVPAQAEITLKDVVTVWSDQVPDPKYVRYAWKDNPVEANLVNEEGLPASPFRTDDLPGPTDGRR